jgi:hypothetical protein
MRAEDERRESGMPGGGRGRRDEVGRTGVYPVSHMEGASQDATTRGEMEWGQGERGAAGYYDHGESEVFTVPVEPTPVEAEAVVPTPAEGASVPAAGSGPTPEAGEASAPSPRGALPPGE